MKQLKQISIIIIATLTTSLTYLSKPALAQEAVPNLGGSWNTCGPTFEADVDASRSNANFYFPPHFVADFAIGVYDTNHDNLINSYPQNQGMPADELARVPKNSFPYSQPPFTQNTPISIGNHVGSPVQTANFSMAPQPDLRGMCGDLLIYGEMHDSAKSAVYFMWFALQDPNVTQRDPSCGPFVFDFGIGSYTGADDPRFASDVHHLSAVGGHLFDGGYDPVGFSPMPVFNPQNPQNGDWDHPQFFESRSANNLQQQAPWNNLVAAEASVSLDPNGIRGSNVIKLNSVNLENIPVIREGAWSGVDLYPLHPEWCTLAIGLTPGTTPPDLYASPDHLRFSYTNSSQRIPAQTIRLSNRGPITADIQSVSLKNGVSNFNVTNNCVRSLGATYSCQISVTCQPSAALSPKTEAPTLSSLSLSTSPLRTGSTSTKLLQPTTGLTTKPPLSQPSTVATYTDFLKINASYQDASGNNIPINKEIPLVCEGIPGPAVGVDPGRLQFVYDPKNPSRTSPQSIQVTNAGNGSNPLTIQSASIIGSNASHFALMGTCPQPLAPYNTHPTDQCSLQVACDPAVSTSKTKTENNWSILTGGISRTTQTVTPSALGGGGIPSIYAALSLETNAGQKTVPLYCYPYLESFPARSGEGIIKEPIYKDIQKSLQPLDGTKSLQQEMMVYPTQEKQPLLPPEPSGISPKGL